MNSKSLIKMLEKDGWELDRIKGSHHVFTHLTKNGIIVVPILKRIFRLEQLVQF